MSQISPSEHPLNRQQLVLKRLQDIAQNMFQINVNICVNSEQQISISLPYNYDSPDKYECERMSAFSDRIMNTLDRMDRTLIHGKTHTIIVHCNYSGCRKVLEHLNKAFPQSQNIGR